MNKKFKPGDKVVWIRHGEQLATVLKVTPKRVKIKTDGLDQLPIIKYVKPESLEFATHLKQQSLLQISSESAKQGWKEDFSARDTIISQFLSGLLSLVIGTGAITIFTILANKINLRYSDNSEHFFFMGATFTFFGLIFLTGYVIKKQFEDAVGYTEIIVSSIRYTFGWWIYAVVLFSILMIFILLIDGLHGFLIVISEITFLTIGFGIAGVIIGSIQYIRLRFEKFDQTKHSELISNDADIFACKMGVLPYRARVRVFWHIFFSGLMGLLFIGISFLSLRDGHAAFILMIGIGGFLAYIAFCFADILINHNFTSVEGQITEKERHSTKGVISYLLICDHQKYMTDSQTWRNTIKGRTYKLWWYHLPFGKKVVASELQPLPKQKDYNDPEQRQFAIAHMKRNKHKYITKALHQGLDGPTSQIESKWASLLSDKYQKVNGLYYTFDIPFENGYFYLGHPVPSELDSNGLSLLNSDVHIDDLVERITADFDTVHPYPNYDLINHVIENWAILVALGGEVVPTLVAAGQESGNITPQALITRLLGDIARDTKNRLSERTSSLVCQNCFVRYAAHKVYLSWVKTNITYYGCRSCGHSRNFFEHSGDIIAVLDEGLEKYLFQDKILKVNWLLHRTMFDFEKVEIIKAIDEDVERFAVQMGNDTDITGYTGGKKMQCVISPDCLLSENTMRILHRMFSQVKVTVV